jgi:hypothetical protein
VNPTQGDEDIFAAVGFEPIREEEGEDEAVKDICPALASITPKVTIRK